MYLVRILLLFMFQLAESTTRIKAFEAELNALIQTQVIKVSTSFLVWVYHTQV